MTSDLTWPHVCIGIYLLATYSKKIMLCHKKWSIPINPFQQIVELLLCIRTIKSVYFIGENFRNVSPSELFFKNISINDRYNKMLESKNS